MTGIEAVVFDVGETLVDETSAWEAWADHLGVPRFTFMAILGAIVSHGQDHRRIFEVLGSGVAPTADPPGWERSEDDLYPDAVPTIQALVEHRVRVGVVGNQAAATGGFFADLGLPLELIGTSQAWGVAKPDPAFFARIAAELELPPATIAYVGDRFDNDVRPAIEAGMVGVLIRRGPWAIWDALDLEESRADVTIDSLEELLAEVRD